MMDLPHELVEQVARGNMVVLVGAGLSVGAGLPGWNTLLTPLADSIRLPQDRRADLLKVAQYYENARGRQALIAHLMQQSDTIGKMPSNNHHRLVRLGINAWVTTNYDDLIEQAFRTAGKRFTRVVRDQDVPYVSADTVTLIKLHGDLAQPETLIVTEQDYHTYFRRFPRIKDKLTTLLLDRTFLFVGYGINDPDFNQLRAEFASDLRQHARMAYAILFDADGFTVTDLKAQNIQVINIALENGRDHGERLGEVLDDLIHQVDLARGQKPFLGRPASIIQTSLDAEEARGLLEAIGYRISGSQSSGADLYFLCEAKSGADVRQEVIQFVAGMPTASSIVALNEFVVNHGAVRGVLLTRHPLPAPLRDLARRRECIQCYTLDEFTDRLADFRPYLERLIADYEASEIPQYYVPLSVEAKVGEGREPQAFKPIESFVDAWLTEPGRNHLSILGDFGSGKTWFCQRYAYLATKRYLADPAHNRIPILITLRDYSRAYDVEQLITDAIANRYKVSLVAGYKTFARLNQAGRLLLLFDGFDEMERRVSDYRTTVDNFWELARAVGPTSKVLLTCQAAYFRQRGEEEETLIPRQRGVSVVTGNQVIDLRDRQGFEVVHLMGFDDEDIRLAVQRRLQVSSEQASQMIRLIQQRTNLRDLAARPALLDMIVKVLPQIGAIGQINPATLYEAYVDMLVTRTWREEPDRISPQERLFLVQELAWEMYTSQRLTIHFSEFPERMTKHFGLKDNSERAAFFERDLRTQSYLMRDDTGNYSFAHKSFMEYFVARKLADAISGPSFDFDKAIDTWKAQPLTLEVRDFLLHMIASPTPLWRIIEAIESQSTENAGYLGRNAEWLLTYLVSPNPEKTVSFFDTWDAIAGRFRDWQRIQASRSDGKATRSSTPISDSAVDVICQELAGLLNSRTWGRPSIRGKFASGMFLHCTELLENMNLPTQVPCIFLTQPGLVEADAEELRAVLGTQLYSARVALFFVFEDSGQVEAIQAVLKRRLKDVYAYDLVVIGRKELLRILVAPNVQRQFRHLILQHVDLVSVSPFVITGSTPDSVFFGREQEIRQITERASQASFAIIGGRRIGKSSLLGRLHRVSLPAAGLRTLYRDCSAVPLHDILSDTAVKDWRSPLPLDVHDTLDNGLRSPAADKPLVLLLDEADKLVPVDRAGKWPLFSALRALANSGQTQVVLSGERTLRDALRDPESPLFNFTNEILLGPLDQRAVEELVTHLMEQLEIDLVGERAIVERMWAFTSGHPNVVQRLCHRLVERLNDEGTRQITLEKVDAIIEDPAFQRDDFLSTYWEASTSLEKIVSLLMVGNKRIRTLPSLQRAFEKRCNLHPNARDVDGALQRLVDLRSILKRTPTGYEFAVDAFPRVVNRTITLTDMLEILTEEYQERGE